MGVCGYNRAFARQVQDRTLEQTIHLSVVATSRNDNHGGSLTHRMQHFVDGFVAQCKRHGLRAELILVEWNPPADRVSLAQELGWPKDLGPCEIRVVTVPREAHARIPNADKIPLFQMLAKNVGIRRARGKYVLATNIDILFSDAAVVLMRDRLQPGCLYRAERVDVPTEVPESEDFADVLDFCDREGFRVHAAAHTVVRQGPEWTRTERLRVRLDARLLYLGHFLRQLLRMVRGGFRFLGAALVSPTLAREKFAHFVEVTTPPNSSPLHAAVASLASPGPAPAPPPSTAFGRIRRYVSERLTRVPRRMFLAWPFTNACGDFTLLSREDWFRLGGYPEWPVFSWHLDSILVYQARAIGLREKSFGPHARVYHIEHGKGYTPEGASVLFSSLTSRGIPFLTDADLWQVHSHFTGRSRFRQSPLFNDSSWGMADADLPVASISRPKGRHDAEHRNANIH